MKGKELLESGSQLSFFLLSFKELPSLFPTFQVYPFFARKAVIGGGAVNFWLESKVFGPPLFDTANMFRHKMYVPSYLLYCFTLHYDMDKGLDSIVLDMIQIEVFCSYVHNPNALTTSDVTRPIRLISGPNIKKKRWVRNAIHWAGLIASFL